MTQELMERTVREWVFSNPERGARDLKRLASAPGPAASIEQIAEALIEVAGRMEIARTRAW
jgi:hypothetical protein